MILPLEKQVCSLASAKKLKELGFPQESLFYWLQCVAPATGSTLFYEKELTVKDLTLYKDEFISAYTCAELGELLPEETYSLKTIQWAVTSCIHDNIYLYADTEVECKAKMLIYLCEQGLLKKGTYDQP